MKSVSVVFDIPLWFLMHTLSLHASFICTLLCVPCCREIGKENYSNSRQIDKIFKNNIKDMEEIHGAK